MDEINNSKSCVEGYRSYEQLKPSDAMNSSGLRIISMILGCEPMSPNVMNNSRLWMKLKTPSHGVRVVDAIKSSELWMT